MAQKKSLFLALSIAIIFLLPALYWVGLQYRSQQLWLIVSQHCVPEQRQFGISTSCLLVNMGQGYAIFNDANGPLHTLLIPTERISGIESPVLLQANGENYFKYAWDTRNFLQQKAMFPIADSYLALAINSRYGRSQHQLHIHLACLKPDVYQTILQHHQEIGHQWQHFSHRLAGRRYLAIKVSAATNPFTRLAQFVQDQGDHMENYGLARIMIDKGEAILLAMRLDPMAFTLGSAEELLDVGCRLAQQPVH